MTSISRSKLLDYKRKLEIELKIENIPERKQRLQRLLSSIERDLDNSSSISAVRKQGSDPKRSSSEMTDIAVQNELYRLRTECTKIAPGGKPNPLNLKNYGSLCDRIAELEEELKTRECVSKTAQSELDDKERIDSQEAIVREIEADFSDTPNIELIKNDIDIAPMNNHQMPLQTKEMQQIEVRRHLQEAKDVNSEGNYADADRILNEAGQLANEDKTLLTEYQSAASSINKQRAKKASNLVEQLRKLFTATPLDENEIESLLAQLVQLDEDRASGFQQQLASKREAQQGHLLFIETKTECEALWRRADELIKENTPYPTVLSATYDKAVQIAEQAASASNIPELQGLLRTARQELEKARKRFEVMSTAAEVGAYEEMMGILDREKDESKTIQLIGPGGELLDTMSVRAAKQQVLIMAEEFAHKKATGYLEAAKIHMIAHAPGAALIELNRSESLFKLDGETKRKLSNYRRDTVEPEVARFNEAQNLLDTARNSVGAASKTWGLIDQAAASYEWLPGLDEARVSLLPRLQAQVEENVETVKQILRLSTTENHVTQFDMQEIKKAATEAQTAIDLAQNLIHYIEQVTGNIGLVQKKAHEAKRIADEANKALKDAGVGEGVAPEQHILAVAQAESAGRYAQYAAEAVKRVEALKENSHALNGLRRQAQTLYRQAQAQHQLIGELDTAIVELRSLLQSNEAAAGNRWQALKDQYGDEVLEAYGPLNRLGRDLDIRLNIIGLLSRLEQDFSSNAPVRIMQAIQDCKQVMEHRENLDYADQLRQIHEKLNSRLAFLAGKSDADTGDADAALQQLSKVTSGPDMEKAEQLIAAIQKELEKDQEIEYALKNAKPLLETDPRQAYSMLEPYEKSTSSHHVAVVETLSVARIKWEAQILQALQDGLSESLDDDKVEKLRNLERELRIELGIAENKYARRALASCFAYEAETAVSLKEYESAIELWNKAIGLDRKVEYADGRVIAQMKYAEQLVSETPEAAAPVIMELRDEIHDNPDFQYWVARLYVRQAQQQDVSATDAESLYNKAAIELAVGIEQAARHAGVQGAALKGKLDALQTVIHTGQEVERRKETIERQLTPSRTVQSFHETCRKAESLLDDNPRYPRSELPTLAKWWRELRKKVVNELEAKASRIPADQLWKRFEPLGKILALDINHGEATAMLNQIDRLISDLERESDLLDKDVNGLSIKVTSDADVLAKQIEQTKDIQRRTDAIYATLINFTTHPVLKGNSGKALATLNRLSANLQTTLERFDRFNNLKSQADALLTMSRYNGDWNAFDTLLGEIAEAGFGTHRTTNALRDARDQDQERRRELKEWASQLELYAQAGNFVAALRLADRLQSPELGDKNDEFGVQKKISYQDPVTQQLKKSLRRIRPLLEEKAEQSATISDWLLNCGLGILSEQHDLISDTINLANVPKIVDWDAEKQKAVAYKRKGQFKKAVNVCENADHGSLSSNTLSLTEAIELLGQRPKLTHQAQSKLAQGLLAQAAAKRDDLEAERRDVTETIDRLKRQRGEWEDSWDAFVRANRQWLQAKNSRNPFGKANRILLAENKRDAALYQCDQICPEHPDLHGISNMEG